MIQDSVDGVLVFRAEAPAPCSAGRVFGVGRRDETFVKGGLTHLVEHLVVRRLGRTPLEANASVDLSSTEFRATRRRARPRGGPRWSLRPVLSR